jgi:hypothetical protein
MKKILLIISLILCFNVSNVIADCNSWDIWIYGKIITCTDFGDSSGLDQDTLCSTHSWKSKLWLKVNDYEDWVYCDLWIPALTSTTDIPNSKKAWSGNLVINLWTFRDDNWYNLGDITARYDSDPNINYTIQIVWPKKTISSVTYTWNLPSWYENSADSTTIWTAQDWNSRSHTFSLTKAWLYQINIILTDKAGRINTVVNNKIITIYPADVYWSQSTVSLDTISTTNVSGSKFANNYDTYKYNVQLKDQYWNYIWSKTISSVTQDCNWITWCDTIQLFETNPNDGENATVAVLSTQTDSDWKTIFTLKSYTPWQFNEIFKVNVPIWWDNYIDNWNTDVYIWQYSYKNTFKKPIILEDILVSSDSWITYSSTWLALWKEQRYKLVLKKDAWATLSWYSSWSIFIKENETIQTSTWYYFIEWSFTWVVDVFSNINITPPLWFTWTLDFVDSSGVLKVKAVEMPIYYKIWWKYIGYYLDDNELTWICENTTKHVKVLWNIQSDGKATWVQQEENFSDLSTAEMRWIIKKNATLLVRWMIWNEIDNPINWVKYVNYTSTGTYTINTPINYETLIVRNGNVFINWNVSSNSWKPLWIIVLKDNYDVNRDYDQAWNVYIAYDVKNINAVIYADWALRSANSSWKSYDDSYLWNRLSIKWSVFTRNTIWWATWTEDKWYLLPWWKGLVKTIANFDLTQKYDLNYLRKTEICSYDDYSLLIEYDSKLQTNPPKGFSR